MPTKVIQGHRARHHSSTVIANRKSRGRRGASVVVLPRRGNSVRPLQRTAHGGPVGEACDAAVRRIFGVNPHDWTGDFIAHCTGKTGELIFLTGALPALRRRLPRARIVCLTQPFYEPLLQRVKHRFDAVAHLGYICDDYATQVEMHYNDYRTSGFVRNGNSISVNVYALHGQTGRSFYHTFAMAMGLQPGEYERPGYDAGPNIREPYALALASLNRHSSPRRVLPFSAEEWETLARCLRNKGLTPLATGHPHDPRPNMPGWEWVEGDVQDALSLVAHANYTLCGNSGMGFLAALLSSGPVVMIDESKWKHLPHINPSSMTDLFAPGRITHVPCEAREVAARRPFAAASAVAARLP